MKLFIDRFKEKYHIGVQTLKSDLKSTRMSYIEYFVKCYTATCILQQYSVPTNLLKMVNFK